MCATVHTAPILPGQSGEGNQIRLVLFQDAILD